ncbi:hypothetical protein BaRGS_00012958 [Batillaria attramentaria]|uniref:Novel STAND NTPase 3 domain-containing protein n=1 Tax=Batillaria attramentaria TaxID=370345 RepID=A0ABD0L8X3_9CAEN
MASPEPLADKGALVEPGTSSGHHDDATEPKEVATTDDICGAMSTRGHWMTVNVPQHCQGPINIGGEVNTTHNYNELHQHIECLGPVQPRRMVQKNTYNYNICLVDHTERHLDSGDVSDVTLAAEPFRFVHTEHMEQALSLLDTQYRVVLCGPPGSGKTTIGRALLRQYHEKGFRSYTVANVPELNIIMREKKNVIVFLDGVLGEVRMDKGEYNAFRSVLETVVESLKVRNCRLVVTMYSHIIREIRMTDRYSLGSLMRPTDVVQTHKKPINKDQKMAMLQMYLQELELETARQDALVSKILQKDFSGAAFPWCCRQMVDNWQSMADPTVFFAAPSEAHVSLLQRMLSDPCHGEVFAAVMSLTMLGFGRFLHHPRRVQQQLDLLGFRNFSIDRLEQYADVLRGSFIDEEGITFLSRIMYDAVGLAIGRSFRLPTLLRVCDARFLVQHVRTKETATEFSITIGTRPDGRQLLMQTMYDHMVSGRLPELCQHPSLQCPQFLQEFEAFCGRENLIQQLMEATDTRFGMSLIYWSAWCMSNDLTTWCLSLMERETLTVRRMDSTQIFSATIVSALLENSIEQYTPRAKLAWKVLQRMSPLRSSSYYQASNLPLPSSSQRVTQDLESLRNRVIMHLQSANLCYLGDHSLPIRDNLIHVSRSTGDGFDKVCMFVHNKQWYLALRLLTDREVDEADDEGNTLLHVAAGVGVVDAVTVAVKSGASLTARNNTGHTPPELTCNRRNNGTIHGACAAGDAEKVKVLLCTGATVHDRDREGNTPLHTACKAGKTDVATLLISLGADVNARNKNGVKPYQCALSNEHIDTAIVSGRNTTDANMGNDADGANVGGRRRCIYILLIPMFVILGILFAGRGLKFNTQSHTERFRSAPKAGHWNENLNQWTAYINMKTNGGYGPLHLASALGQTDAVRLLLENGADVNVMSHNRDTPLHIASLVGQTDVAALLISNNADVNVQNDDIGFSPLHVASMRGNVGIVRLLLKSGAEVNLKNARGLTPLYLACGNGRTEIARILLQNMADTNTKESEIGSTPLHAAAIHNHTKTVRLLLAHGADVNVKADFGLTPLHLASDTGQTEIAELLVHRKADVNVQTKDGVTPLLLAIQHDHLKTARLLITNNADINSTNEQLNDTTLLHTAIHFRRTEIVKLMLQNNVNISVKDVQGLTPLHYACFKNHTEMVRLFVEHGADVNAKGGNLTPLQIACKSGLTEIANILIQNNADMNVTYNENKDTLLHFVHWYDKNDIVRLLIHNGADPNAKNAKGQTPLHMAAMYNKSELTLLLLQNKANPNIRSYGDGFTALQFAITFNHTKIVSLLLQYGADPDARDIKGFAPLHIFSLKGRTAIVQLLVQTGADVNAEDSVRHTPLHFACMKGQTETARLLIQGGADVNAEAEDGLRPLHYAASASNTETVRLLLQNDADSQVVDNNGLTALHHAAESGKKEVAQAVLESNPGIVNMRCVTGLSALHVACLNEHEQVARFLIDSKADVNLMAEGGYTPLHLTRTRRIASLLIQNKAHVNAVAFNGQTPLDVAYQQGQTLLATFLTKHGAKRFIDL